MLNEKIHKIIFLFYIIKSKKKTFRIAIKKMNKTINNINIKKYRLFFINNVFNTQIINDFKSY